jgi:hypothetical protein
MGESLKGYLFLISNSTDLGWWKKILVTLIHFSSSSHVSPRSLAARLDGDACTITLVMAITGKEAR